MWENEGKGISSFSQWAPLCLHKSRNSISRSVRRTTVPRFTLINKVWRKQTVECLINLPLKMENIWSLMHFTIFWEILDSDVQFWALGNCTTLLVNTEQIIYNGSSLFAAKWQYLNHPKKSIWPYSTDIDWWGRWLLLVWMMMFRQKYWAVKGG